MQRTTKTNNTRTYSISGYCGVGEEKDAEEEGERDHRRDGHWVSCNQPCLAEAKAKLIYMEASKRITLAGISRKSMEPLFGHFSSTLCP
jgi:hypothetical protein